MGEVLGYNVGKVAELQEVGELDRGVGVGGEQDGVEGLGWEVWW